MLAALLAATGCSKQETEPATPNGDPAPSGPQTFTLELPRAATTIEQGGDRKMSISANKGERFDDEIELTFDPPEGISIEPETVTVARGETDAEFTVKVDGDAAAGEKSIPVTGRSGTGLKTSGSFKIEVVQRQQSEEKKDLRDLPQGP